MKILAFSDVHCDHTACIALVAAATGADIMVCHSPPKGVVDVMASRGSMRSIEIRETILQVQPRLMVCGHVHDCWGARGKIGQTEVANLGPNVNWIELEI